MEASTISLRGRVGVSHVVREGFWLVSSSLPFCVSPPVSLSLPFSDLSSSSSSSSLEMELHSVSTAMEFIMGSVSTLLSSIHTSVATHLLSVLTVARWAVECLVSNEGAVPSTAATGEVGGSCPLLLLEEGRGGEVGGGCSWGEGRVGEVGGRGVGELV